MFLAVINTPGYLSEQDDVPEFETAREAWCYLADERARAEEEEESEGYSETFNRLAVLGTEALWRRDDRSEWFTESGLTPDGWGTIYGPSVPARMHDLGVAYSVIAKA